MNKILCAVLLAGAASMAFAAPIPSGSYATPVVVDQAGTVVGRYIVGFDRHYVASPGVLVPYLNDFVLFDILPNFQTTARFDGFVLGTGSLVFANSSCDVPTYIMLDRTSASVTRLVGGTDYIVSRTGTTVRGAIGKRDSVRVVDLAGMYFKNHELNSCRIMSGGVSTPVVPVIATVPLPAGQLYVK